MEDLEALVALEFAAGGVGIGDAGDEPLALAVAPLGAQVDYDDADLALRANVVAPLADVASIQEAEQVGLEELVALHPGVQRQYRQRSWELMAAARAAKKHKQDALVNATKQAQLDEAIAKVNEVASEFPIVATQLGVCMKGRQPLGDDRARILTKLSFMPAIKGNHSARNRQNRACAVVSRVLTLECARYCDAIFGREDAPRLDLVPVDRAHQAFQIKLLAWEWDETCQRLQALRAKSLTGERVGRHKVAVQVMVQRGTIALYEFGGDSCGQVVEEQPIFVKALRLQSTASDFLLEALLKCMPVDPSNAQEINAIADGSEALLLTWVCDRASSNLISLRWMFEQLNSPGVDKTILPYADLCAAHGVALVKGRAVMGKSAVQTVSSFTCLTKNWRFMDALRDSIICLVGKFLKVKREPRPHDQKVRNERLIHVLFGDVLQALRLAGEQKRGGHKKSRLEHDLDQISAAFSLLPGCGLDDMVHYCWVEPGSVDFENGATEGSACCQSREEAVDKVAMPFLNVVVHSSWSTTAASRWTYVVETFRRICLGFSCNALLPTALKEVQVQWNAADGLEATLLRIIAADVGDFHSKSRLRLLRVVRGFAQPDSGWKACILLTTLLVIDKVLFGILGNGTTGSRAKVYDLISFEKSLVAQASEDLLRLLQSWGPGSVDWVLLETIGGDNVFEEESVKKWARAQIIQLVAGLVDVFEIRYSRPPWSLLRFIDPAVPVEEQERVFQDAVDMPEHCRPLFLKRLLQQCPTMHAMRNRGVHILRSLNEGSGISVDFSERSHGQMRLDMRSSGRAKSATASACRVYCQQVRVELIARGLSDPASSSSGASGLGRCDGTKVGDPGRKHANAVKAGNPYISFQNHSMATYKTTHAKGRAMTKQERHKVLVRAREAWHTMAPYQRDNWHTVYKVSLIQKRLGDRQPIGGCTPSNDPVAKTLWRLPNNQGSNLLPVQGIRESYTRFSGSNAKEVYEDQSLRVLGPVPARGSALPPQADESDLVFGCTKSRKMFAGMA